MSGETQQHISGWTVDTLKEHGDRVDTLLEVHRKEIKELTAQIDKANDRRLAEVAVEREKALKIKETADLAALQLAREIQTYKDEKANELREQIGNERGLYASKADLRASVEKLEAVLNPLLTWVASQQGSGKGMRDMWGWVAAAIMLGLSALSFFLKR